MDLDRADGDEMIEIDDPNVEPFEGEPPARVVIEYRDRGVPWMLVPPMLVVAGVVAVLGHARLAPQPPPIRVAPPESESLAVAPVTVQAPGPLETPVVLAKAPAVDPEPAPRVPATEPVKGAVAVAVDTPEPSPVPTAPVLEPAPPIKVEGLGFDPRALLDTDRDPQPPAAADPALAPAAAALDNRNPAARPADPALNPEVRALPEEVDPGVLPVDPREARLRRQQRVAEARRKAEAERGQFHADLRAIYRRLGDRSAPEIEALCQKYGLDVDPVIKTQAAQLLNASAAGVNRPTRINLLRNLGFSEPVILVDLFDCMVKWEKGSERGGARSEDEVKVRSALILLGYPPNRVATPSRPVSTSRPAR